ncbi:hypothetical protein HPP92_019314 [Vanilla planifolia]|uniref:Pentatricopeptide repeat-containing protein n=1 Tax=Vanilla planifolia TaxID=51239 RepID=A0A835Q6K5_VANPL|nr:hypothetical protein HPP92_019314 [Vanilla planifolia]
MGVIDEGRRAFDDICLPNVVSYTALVSGYIKNNQLDEAFRLFEEMPERTVVTWNAMISGFCQMGLHEESVNLFVEMRRVGVAPSSSTFTCILTAAACISALAMGRSFHADTVKVLAKLDVYVGNSLLSFYARCGCLEDGILVFEGLEESNIVSWNAVIWGYAQNGKGEEALETFKRIESGSLRPNDVTLLGLLFGCNHSGLVDEGITIFNRMREEDPSIVKPEHYASVVDLLSRSGRLPEAEKFLKELPFEPGLGFWKSLLGGCQIHRKKELAMRVSERILEVNQHDISSFVLLSNVQSSVGHWDNVSSIRRKMLEKGVKRVPGCSWIEVQGRLHVFFNGDRRHSQADDIYFLLRIMPYQGEQSALFN